MRTGNTMEVRSHLRYKGPYEKGPKSLTALLPLLSVIPQGTGKLNEENPLLLKANQSVELLLWEGGFSPHTHLVDVTVHPSLQEGGIVRGPSVVGPDETYRLFYTAQRNVDLAELPWLVSLRLRD